MGKNSISISTVKLSNLIRTESNRSEPYQKLGKISVERIFNFFSNLYYSIRLNRTRVKSLFCIESIEANALFGQKASSIRPNRIMKIKNSISFCQTFQTESKSIETNRIEFRVPIKFESFIVVRFGRIESLQI